MRKTTKLYADKSAAELTKEAAVLRNEIAKMQIERMAVPQKDSNLIAKKKKQLAVLLTVKAGKQEINK